MSALPNPVPKPVHNGYKNSSMPNVRSFPSGYATVQAVQELNARMDELSARIDQLLSVHTVEESPVESIEAAPDENPAGVRPNRPAGLRCPQCNKRAFRPTRRTGIGEKLSLLVLLRPFRCRYCAFFEFRSVFTRTTE